MKGKTIDISCGHGDTTVKWLGHVAIARSDEASCRGYLRLGMGSSCSNILLIDSLTGVPTAVISHRTDISLPLDQKIKDVIQDGDHVDIETSLGNASPSCAVCY